ncbi:MAG: hypothetical protein JXA96_13675 [Sedimentisphaerales bacterium]|nr:hypothetical protein [Sedimentisphaerales bacterium]
MDNKENSTNESHSTNPLRFYIDNWDIFCFVVTIILIILFSSGLASYLCGRFNIHLAGVYFLSLFGTLGTFLIFFLVNIVRIFRKNILKKRLLILFEICLPIIFFLSFFLFSFIWDSKDPFLCGHRDQVLKRINIKEAQAWLKTIIDEEGKFKKEISHDDIPEFLKKAGYYRIYIDEFGNPMIYSGYGGGFFHWGSVIGTEDMVYTESQIKEKSKHDEEVLLSQPGFYVFAQY